jgi:hypothetical protein
MATWNRRVTVTGDNQYLQVDNLTPDPNPPGANDPPDSITTDAAERPATINYLANGPQLTGIEMKDGSTIPSWVAVSTKGRNLCVVDSGGSGTSASYYLVGNWGNAPSNPIRSQDPQIHNE